MANPQNVEQFERMRMNDGAMTVSQESSGKDNVPPEDGTEAQDSENGSLLVATTSKFTLSTHDILHITYTVHQRIYFLTAFTISQNPR